MKTLERILAGAATLFLMGGLADSFAPFQDWKAAVMAGDQAALTRLYAGNLEDACRYWAGMKSSGVTGFNPKVLTVSGREGKTALVLRVEALKDGQPVVGSVVQYWAQEAGGWHIIAEKRGEFGPNETRRLPQPATPNTALYSDPNDAQEELNGALAKAAKDKKRVLVVFGANWCYDCSVLDTTFHAKGFAPLVNANYVVVHINIGDDGKEKVRHKGYRVPYGRGSVGRIHLQSAQVPDISGEFLAPANPGVDDLESVAFVVPL